MVKYHNRVLSAGLTVAVGVALATVLLYMLWRSEFKDQSAPMSARHTRLGEISLELEQTPSEKLHSIDGDATQRGNASSVVRETSANGPVVEQVELAARSQEDEWEAETEGMTRGQIDTMIRDVNDQIIAESNEWFDAAFESGLTSVAGTGSSFKSTDWDDSIVMRVKMPSSRTDGEDWQVTGLIRKAVLPESQFPQVYHLKRKSNWLKARSREMLQQEIADK